MNNNWRILEKQQQAQEHSDNAKKAAGKLLTEMLSETDTILPDNTVNPLQMRLRNPEGYYSKMLVEFSGASHQRRVAALSKLTPKELDRISDSFSEARIIAHERSIKNAVRVAVELGIDFNEWFGYLRSHNII